MPAADRDENSGPLGVLVAPGTYQVAMSRRIDGETIALDQQQSFEVVSIREPTLPGSSQEQRIAFQRQVDTMRRAVEGTLKSIDEVLTQLAAIEDVLRDSGAEPGLYADANDIEQRLRVQRDRIAGNETRANLGVNRPMPITSRLSHAAYSPATNAYGPTPTQRESLAIAEREYAEIALLLTALVDREYTALREALDEAGAPWTPGRGIMRP